MVGWLFPGQGAQYLGMGRDLYEGFPSARKIFDTADEILGFKISRLCFEGPEAELTLTHNCQPAILTISIAALEVFKEHTSLKPLEKKLAPGFTAGLSLGEYCALVAAGALSFKDALGLVKKRSQFMEEEARKQPGKMMAILGLEKDRLQAICDKTRFEIANLNCPGQIVISGPIESLEAVKEEILAAGAKKAVTLDVSGAFHSSLMKNAAIRLESELENIEIRQAKIPIVSNVDALATQDPLKIRKNLVTQMTSCVRWEDSIRLILKEGVKTFFEIGPGNVLKGLLRRIEPALEVYNIGKIEDVINFKFN